MARRRRSASSRGLNFALFSGMTNAIQITFHGLEHSQALSEEVRRRAEELAAHHPELSRCRVVLEAPHRSHRKGNLFSVHVELRFMTSVGATQCMDGRCEHEDMYQAIHVAFDTMQRRASAHTKHAGVHDRQSIRPE